MLIYSFLQNSSTQIDKNYNYQLAKMEKFDDDENITPDDDTGAFRITPNRIRPSVGRYEKLDQVYIFT